MTMNQNALFDGQMVLVYIIAVCLELMEILSIAYEQTERWDILQLINGKLAALTQGFADWCSFYCSVYFVNDYFAV
jgi:hypothetical protein